MASSGAYKSRINITIVGDGFVGKSCLVAAFLQQDFLVDSPPTMIETHLVEMFVDGQDYILQIVDIGDSQKIAPDLFMETDCLVVCFSVDAINSYENVIFRWLPDVYSKCPMASLILVGTKLDLREGTPLPVASFQGLQLAKEIRANCYFECSAKFQVSIAQIFQAAVRTVVQKYNSGPGLERIKGEKNPTVYCTLL
ncbi:unnamed protein product [Allacma fusca]|uniref:Uncharacterized protein n=1 Tax=Allacma fusca TaxID=39272 RepID=A0A8J2PXW7_9HEXA|nr:unnamed protein product [Allacma fusca]